MDTNTIIDCAESPKWIEKTGEAVQPAILKAFESGGETGQAIKNFLHGTWLGHPLHPLLTDIPVGAYTVTAALDVLELCGNDKYKEGADASLGVGLMGAAGAAVTGITDWTATSGQTRNLGTTHALLNIGATVMNVASLFLRKKQSTRKWGIGLSLAAYGVTAASAYLGGALVYGLQMGVDHTATADPYPLEFMNALPESELAEGEMVATRVGEVPVLLAKNKGKIFALANTCSHLGGPLNEGELLSDCCVKCPWHGSLFSLEDGSVIDGPATAAQPKFDVRVVNGMIQVKLAEQETVKRKQSQS